MPYGGVVLRIYLNDNECREMHKNLLMLVSPIL